jgi:hypothetical protein
VLNAALQQAGNALKFNLCAIFLTKALTQQPKEADFGSYLAKIYV